MTATDQPINMSTAIMADAALHFPQSTELFKQYNLEYCCNGKMLFVEACRHANLDSEKVWSEGTLLPMKERGNLLIFEN